MDTTLAAPSPPPTVTIGALTVTLVEPPCLFALALGRSKEQIDADGLAGTLTMGAAALRMCWPADTTWPVRIRPPEWRPGVSLYQYGSDIFEALRKATKGTVRLSALRAAFVAAHNFAVGTALTQDEIEDLQGFSDGQGEGA